MGPPSIVMLLVTLFSVLILTRPVSATRQPLKRPQEVSNLQSATPESPAEAEMPLHRHTGDGCPDGTDLGGTFCSKISRNEYHLLCRPFRNGRLHWAGRSTKVHGSCPDNKRCRVYTGTDPTDAWIDGRKKSRKRKIVKPRISCVPDDGSPMRRYTPKPKKSRKQVTDADRFKRRREFRASTSQATAGEGTSVRQGNDELRLPRSELFDLNAEPIDLNRAALEEFLLSLPTVPDEFSPQN